MKDELEKFVDAIWEERPRPEKVMVGQIWTFFNSQADDTGRGTMTIILKKEEKKVQVIPVHHEMQFVRRIDPILNSKHLDFKDELVVMIDSVVWIDQNKLSEARFIGSTNQSGLELIFSGLVRFQKVSSALSKLQFLQDSGIATEDDEDKAFEDGILELIPVRVSKDEFDLLRKRLELNLVSASQFQLALENIKKQYSNLMELPAQEMTAEMKNNFIEKKQDIILPILQNICKTLYETSIDPKDDALIFAILDKVMPLMSNDLEIEKIHRHVSISTQDKELSQNDTELLQINEVDMDNLCSNLLDFSNIKPNINSSKDSKSNVGI